MNKSLAIVLIFMIKVECYPPGWPLENTRTKLLEYGISAASTNGLLEIVSEYQFPRFHDDPVKDKEYAREVYDAFQRETSQYIDSRSDLDNYNYREFIHAEASTWVLERDLDERILCEDKTKIELQTAGISSESVDGLLEIAARFQFPRFSNDSVEDKELAREEYKAFMDEVEFYIWGQGSLDLHHYLNDFIAIQRKNRVAERRLASRVLCEGNQTNVKECVP